MNLEKEASVSSILKNLWKDTKGLKDLPKDIKRQKMINKLLGRKGLKAFKKYKGIAGNTAKGLVIPAAGAAAVGGSVYGYKQLKGKVKTAGLKDYWDAMKDLSSNIKFYKELKNPASSRYITDGTQTLKDIKAETLSKIKKGLVIPGIGVGVGASATGVGYKALRGREKTAVDKNGLTLSQRRLIADRAALTMSNELFNKRVKDKKRGLAIGSILGSAVGYLLGDRDSKIFRGISTAQGGILGGTFGSALFGIPTGRKYHNQLKAEGITPGFLAPKISPEAKKKYYDQYNK
jgi:hypothetical protein